MGDSLVQKLTMSQVQAKVGTLAQTNHYLVEINLSANLNKHFQKSYPNDPKILEISKFMNTLGHLCSEATLPTSAYATSEVKDNYMGITQEFAHTRLYTDIDLTFYVDSEYSVMRFFEGWMDYIAGGNSSGKDASGRQVAPAEPAAATSLNKNIYRRFNYPDDYKASTLKIHKFERDFSSVLEYTFINAFPKSLNPVSVAYGPSDILKTTVTFNFDRYVVNRTSLVQNSTTKSPTSPVPPTTLPQTEANWRYSEEQLKKFQRDAYINGTNGRIFKGSIGQNLDAQYGVTRNSRGDIVE